MSIFDKKTKEEKQQEEMQKFMDKYQLNDVNEKDLIILRRIAGDLAANGLMKAGLALSFANIADQAKVTYLSALVEQNWLIFRKLDEISKKLDK